MKKIIVTVPKSEAGKWKVSLLGSRGNTRASVATAFQLVERVLNTENNLNSEAKLKLKTAVQVNYSQGFINESLVSDRPQYLLKCLMCFLEEYFSPYVLKGKHRRYELD